MFKTQRNQCFLIVVEGPDMVGKTTQVNRLEVALSSKYRVAYEELPFQDSPTHALIREMLQDGGAVKYAEAFQTLYCINRTDFARNYLPTLALHHDVLILGRWTLSTRVYGSVGGVCSELTDQLLKEVDKVDVDLTFVLDGSGWDRGDLDTFESDVVFQRQIRAKYQEACALDPKIVKIDADRPVDAVHTDVLSRVVAALS